MNNKFLQSGGLVTMAAILTLTIQNLLITPEPAAVAAPAVDQPTEVAATNLSQPFIGGICLFAGNFAPRGWAFCEGQLLPIASNTALFSILGTMYGGDGRTTFGLPDLRGRVALHPGNGPGLPSYNLGQAGGNPSTTLTSQNLPSHFHSVTLPNNASTENGESDEPGGNVPAVAGEDIYSGTADTKQLNSTFNTGATGNNTSFSNMPPYLGVNYIIALQGVFPSRN